MKVEKIFVRIPHYSINELSLNELKAICVAVGATNPDRVVDYLSNEELYKLYLKLEKGIVDE